MWHNLEAQWLSFLFFPSGATAVTGISLAYWLCLPKLSCHKLWTVSGYCGMCWLGICVHLGCTHWYHACFGCLLVASIIGRHTIYMYMYVHSDTLTCVLTSWGQLCALVCLCLGVHPQCRSFMHAKRSKRHCETNVGACQFSGCMCNVFSAMRICVVSTQVQDACMLCSVSLCHVMRCLCTCVYTCIRM